MIQCAMIKAISNIQEEHSVKDERREARLCSIDQSQVPMVESSPCSLFTEPCWTPPQFAYHLSPV